MRLPKMGLFNVARALLAIAFASQGCLGAQLFTRFQIERVALDVLDDVFLQDLSLKSPKRAFQGFCFLEVHFRQKIHLAFKVSG